MQKEKDGRLKKHFFGWLGVGTTTVLLYAALYLTIHVVVPKSPLHPLHELCAWLAVMLYWFLYVPVAVSISWKIMKCSDLLDGAG